MKNENTVEGLVHAVRAAVDDLVSFSEGFVLFNEAELWKALEDFEKVADPERVADSARGVANLVRVRGRHPAARLFKLSSLVSNASDRLKRFLAIPSSPTSGTSTRSWSSRRRLFMPKICYVERKFSAASVSMIEKANEIIAEYENQGFALTLRQLYYQMVSRDIIPNNLKSYKNLGSIVNDARLAGLIDWDHITDRTRSLRRNSHWDNPGDIINSAAAGYRIDMWARQKYRPEVWIEKDALVGVIEQICTELDVPYFSCRGYTSQSEMWVGAQRIEAWARSGRQTPVVFHFGDHDPSGKDMTRDIVDRLQMFMGGVKLERLALNMNQVREYNPPPNPAKITDSRSKGYIAEFGNESWELDALKPDVIVGLVRRNVTALMDKKAWSEDLIRLGTERNLLRKAATEWDGVVGFLGGNGRSES